MLPHRTEEREAFHVAGLSWFGGRDGIGRVAPVIWDVFINQLSTIPNAVSPETLYGMEAFPPMKEEHGFQWSYTACVEVESLDAVPVTFVAKSLPASRYAVFEHHGPIDRISQTFDRIYGEGLKDAGLERAHPFDFELYGPRFKGMAEDSLAEIWVPVS